MEWTCLSVSCPFLSLVLSHLPSFVSSHPLLLSFSVLSSFTLSILILSSAHLPSFLLASAHQMVKPLAPLHGGILEIKKWTKMCFIIPGFPMQLYCGKILDIQHLSYLCTISVLYEGVFLGGRFEIFLRMLVPEKFHENKRVIKICDGLLQMKWGHALKKHVCSCSGIPSSAAFPAPSPLVFPHSPKSHSQAAVFGPVFWDCASQQRGHDPAVNSFVDGDVLYWCGFQAVSPQRVINSPELTLKSTQTVATEPIPPHTHKTGTSDATGFLGGQ